MKINLEKSALLVIDVQNGMFADPGDPVYNEKVFLDCLEMVIQKSRDLGVPLVFIQHNSGPNSPLELDSEGFDIHPRIQPNKEDVRVVKTRPDSFFKTDLKDKLDGMGVTDLIVTGLQTEFCVDTTCRIASSRGYNVYLVKDGHSTFDSPKLKAPDIIRHHNFILGEWFVELIGLKDIH